LNVLLQRIPRLSCRDAAAIIGATPPLAARLAAGTLGA
jgi:hypothetical protein